MKMDRVFLSSPHMSDEGYEMEYVQEAFDTNWIAPLGKNVDEFEKSIKELVGVKAAVALSSGTAALHMALMAANVGEGDLVFCSSFTFSASANPIIYLKAIPVFIDSDYDTWNMSPKALEEAFLYHSRKGKSPKAVIIVDLYGLTADMDKLVEICQRYGALIIEDSAEALGTLYKDRFAGSLGDYGVFSFNGNKLITTSGGGILVSDYEERIKKVKFWATQARDSARHYEHSELGFNYRLSNVLAGIGRGQLKVLNQRINKKKHIFEYYKRELSTVDGIEMMPIKEWNRPNFWLSCIKLSEEGKREKIIAALEEENIEARPVWKPMHLQPFYMKYDFFGEGISEEIFKCGICLPSDTKIRDDSLDRIIQIIKRVIE